MIRKKGKGRRRLKATAAIGVAVVAGTFVGFQRHVTQRIRRLRASGRTLAALAPLVLALTAYACVDPAEVEELKRNQQRIIQMLERMEKECAVEPKKQPSSQTDDTERPSQKAKPKVDLEQHRKGMPVPDNLLE